MKQSDETYSEPVAQVAAPLVDPRLAGVVLGRGAHGNPQDGMCVMEAVAFIAGEKHSDHPSCACRVVGAFMRRLNDRVDDDSRQKLIELVPALAGSRSENRDTWVKRAYVFADFAVRQVLPELLDFLGKPDAGARLRALGKIADRASAELARNEARSARDILRTAAAAAYAYDAAAAAYDAAAYDAAAAAYDAAAYDAAAAAYDAAAYAAAYDAAAYAAAYADADGKLPSFKAKLLLLAIEAIKEALAVK